MQPRILTVSRSLDLSLRSTTGSKSASRKNFCTSNVMTGSSLELIGIFSGYSVSGSYVGAIVVAGENLRRSCKENEEHSSPKRVYTPVWYPGLCGDVMRKYDFIPLSL
eukprot:IDg11157t1